MKNGIVKVKKTIDLSTYGVDSVYSTSNTIDLADLGITFSKGAVSALLTPAPNKAYVTNKSRLEVGARINTANAKMDERTVNLPFIMTAKTLTQFYKRYRAFCAILGKGSIELWCKFIPDMSFRFVYVSCQQFGEYGAAIDGGSQMAKFTLRLTEPDPSDRAVDRATFPHLMLDRDALDEELSQLI